MIKELNVAILLNCDRHRILISCGGFMNKLLFYIKQLLPMKYHSKYSLQNGEKKLAVWTQWFCKPFNIKHFKLAD